MAASASRCSPLSASDSSTSGGQDLARRRCQRATSTMTSGGKQRPAKADPAVERGGSTSPLRGAKPASSGGAPPTGRASSLLTTGQLVSMNGGLVGAGRAHHPREPNPWTPRRSLLGSSSASGWEPQFLRSRRGSHLDETQVVRPGFRTVSSCSGETVGPRRRFRARVARITAGAMP